MIYFLDFDRTLFDTDTFAEKLPELPVAEPFREDIRAAVEAGRANTLSADRGEHDAWQRLYEAVRAAPLSFAPGELEPFLYRDTAEFLRALGNEAIIITFGDEAWQKAKVESALAGVVRKTALYTGNALKADFLSTWPGYYGQEAIYTDDRPHELAAMAAAFPNMRVYEMRRDGAPGDGRWPVVRSLSELP